MKNTILAAIAALLAVACSASDNDDRRAGSRCKEEVKRYVKFPEDASWQNIRGKRVTGDEFAILGEVVTPNAFGVRTRHHFGCRILVKEKWALPLNVIIDGEEM